MEPIYLDLRSRLFPNKTMCLTPIVMQSFLNFEKCSTEQFAAIYEHMKITNSLPFKKKHKRKITKSKEMSNTFRLKGNDEFQRNLQEALVYYSKSIAAAPYPAADDADMSTELALGFANRSAVYVKLKKYEAALKDIEHALFFCYPDNLKYKLFERRTNCYQALGKQDEATKSCQEAINYLPLAKEPPADKMASLSLTLENLSLKTKNRNKPPKDRLGPTEVAYVPKKTYGNHKTIPAASDCLEVIYSEEFGHHAVSTRNINPGDIIIMEKPFMSLLFKENYYSHCHSCLKRSDAMIPCKSCSLVMFCSDDCRTVAWDAFHQTECLLLPLFQKKGSNGSKIHFALLMLLAAMSRYAGNSLVKLREVVNEVEEANRNNKPKSGFGQFGQPYPPMRGYAGIHFLDRERALCEDIPGKLYENPILGASACSAILVNWLDSYTNIFGQKSETQGPSPGDLKIFAGRMIMRYLLIIPFNSSRFGDFKYCPDSSEFVGVDCGLSVSNMVGFFNHSCCCNTGTFTYNGSSLVAVALQPIKKGDQLFVNYGSSFLEKNLKERTAFLLDCNTICCCEACLNDWPTALKMEEENQFEVICTKCRTTIPLSKHLNVRCPKCRMKKDMSAVVKACFILEERMDVISYAIHQRSSFAKDFTPELSQFLIFMYNNFRMPNMLVYRLQLCLAKCFRRCNNNNGLWAPECCGEI